VQFKHGRLKMTQPSLLCLKREHPSMRPKIFLRTLRYTTAPQGPRHRKHILERSAGLRHIHLRFLGHTEDGKLTLGSGLFVGSTGIASDHHFNPREGVYNFFYGGGQYLIEVSGNCSSFGTAAAGPMTEVLKSRRPFVYGNSEPWTLSGNEHFESVCRASGSDARRERTK
jgi:hypothetical protein